MVQKQCETQELSEFIRDHLAMKADVREIVRTELSGYATKDHVDHALERIGAIEKHLGINQKIAA